MKTHLIVCPRNTTHKKELKIMLEELDGKRWIIARETGRSGYKHWQCRVSVSGDLGAWAKRNGLSWHIEDANEVWDYEQKEGDYFCSWDTLESRKLRTGRLRRDQIHLLRSLDKQNDRMVTIWVDPKGGMGKTFAYLLGTIRGEVLPVPASGITSTKLSGWIKSAWKNQRIIWIDIPRAHKLDSELWKAIEEAKGIVYDWRYASSWTVTYGVKILVTTNSEIDSKNLACLSADRWDIHRVAEYYVSDGGIKTEE